MASIASIAGTTDCTLRSLRTAFFTGARLGLVLAAVRFVAFAALDTLRGLPRLAEFALRSFRFCTFDAFLRLAMIVPCSGWCSAKALMDHQVPATHPMSYKQVISAKDGAS